MTQPADPGLQPERTALAWRRTALSVTVGSLVALRVLPPELGPIGYAVSVLGLLWGLDLALAARHRYRDAARMVAAGSGATTAGVAVARTAVVSGLVGVAALVVVVVLWTR
ncbi:DUF202 domain-containing protein [Terrabacter sp. NPDC080008]|uniref:DUF202 domain-containing protein n=1 Tax=Terrabacter sp. NPDC080008 TaxID=3155176 RepID=UPI00344BD7D0